MSMEYDSFDAMLHFIFRSTQGDAWFKPTEENVSAGVCIRVEPGHFRTFPYDNPFLAPFEAAVRGLNPLVAAKTRTAAAHSALATVPENASAIYIDANTRIQILETVSHLPLADKEQCAAFLRDERVLVVWCDDLDQIVPLCKEFNEKLMKLVWRSRIGSTSASILTSRTSLSVPSISSDMNFAEKGAASVPVPTVGTTVKGDEREKEKAVAATSTAKPRKWWSWRLSGRARSSPEPVSGADAEKPTDPRLTRPIRLLAPFYSGLGFGLAVFFVASGFAIMLQEFRLDQDYTRFAVLVTFPLLICVSLFFALQIIANLSFCIGPVAQYHENSRYYSAVKPEENPEVDSKLPHITLEMPVYKESLEDTISPSVFSLKKAMQTYARQGGTSSIFVHDDGLQSMSLEEREKRITFYADHNIGWVARPPHSNDPDGFKRAGRFKKASNMNYGLQLSLCMEKHILALEASGEKFDSTFDQDLEDRALELAIEETYKGSSERWKPWASNARALRVGDIILLVDSDTIVPEDCLRDAARELAECPDVAVIQHESDVMQVANHYFENGIAYFTKRINRCISIGCANGEVAPFVGHNAFLRWSALQEAAFVDPDDGVTKIWSESNVSEDFDMALRLQLKGYMIRWATYSEGGFKEGVSLTADDELNRWQKYAYGCNELIFNPIIRWWRVGPINKQLRTFLWSDAPVHYKITMMSYMFSYYGLAASFLLSFLNYLMLGLAFEVDGFYMHSFEIFLACAVIFPGLGNVGYTLLEYRLGHRDLLSALFENLIWIPFFFFFFGGLSIHISIALLAHMFSYNITWGATKKEVERSNFWKEVPKILTRFRVSLIICFLTTCAIVILATPVLPSAWQIPVTNWAVVVPLGIAILGHVLYPIVLNPWLMIFSY
ncbi:glycosyl transferase family group 2-domain-containing protein [Ephemerocybe angulata]|uniref:Glycosyl transferase family group 2-domain-containing protein n=1 Tax=Ephemerocybe angulata TaxID=980116 RepID=A0A8H6HUJ3_9AGAR|nr:glycosyl transferase family group 2-domain-containing protein [Tulosesus angulatus]